MSMDAARYGRYATGDYLEYQRRYATQVRESDRMIIDIVRGIVEDGPHVSAPSLLDVGCSTGNLLRHLRRLVPALALHGGDLYPPIIEQDRADPELAGIDFEVVDILDLKPGRTFDIVVVNAVLYLFSERDLDRAVAGLSRALHPGGRLVVFDLFHPFEQGLEIVERSETHPEGLRLHFRPISTVRRVLEGNGLREVSFVPFRIPIDLPRPQRAGDISSYTVASATGDRLIFRGALFTPWCHLVAEKTAR